MLATNVQNGLGIQDVDYKARVIARAAFLRGQVGMFDIANTDPDVTNNLDGDEASGLCNIVTATSTAPQASLGGVFLDDVSDNQKQFLMYAGHAYVYVTRASGDIAKNENLCMVSGQKYLRSYTDASAGDRFVAQALEGKTAPTTPTLCWCRVNFVYGFGVKA